MGAGVLLDSITFGFDGAVLSKMGDGMRMRVEVGNGGNVLVETKVVVTNGCGATGKLYLLATVSLKTNRLTAINNETDPTPSKRQPRLYFCCLAL